MSAPPEKNIEALLKAAAEKRKQEAGAPFELRPASRKLLQDEVARVYRSNAPQRPPVFAWLAGVRPWFAAAVGLFCVLVGLMIWSPALEKAGPSAEPGQTVRQRESELPRLTAAKPAEAESRSLGLSAPTTLAAPSAAPRPADEGKLAQLRRDENPRDKSVAIEDRSQLSAAPTPRGAESGEKLAEAKDLASEVGKLSKQTQLMDLGLASQVGKPVAEAAPSSRLAYVNWAYQVPPTQSAKAENRPERFLNESRGVAVTNVLSSFEMLQVGQQIRVIDADGSTYDGTVFPVAPDQSTFGLSPDVLARTNVLARRAYDAYADLAGVTGSTTSVVAGQSYGFRVAGTNQKLQQSVVFVGAVESGANAPEPAVALGGIAANAAAGAGGQLAATASNSITSFNGAVMQNSLFFQNSRVRGQATIGGSNQIQVDAVPAKK